MQHPEKMGWKAMCQKMNDCGDQYVMTLRSQCAPEKFMEVCDALCACCTGGTNKDYYHRVYQERRRFWEMTYEDQSSHLISSWNSYWNAKDNELQILLQSWPVCRDCHRVALGVSEKRYSRVYKAWRDSDRTIQRVLSNHRARVRGAQKTVYITTYLSELGTVIY